jgi:SulP family sulfate permease
VGDLTGFYSQAENKVLRALDTIVNFREIDSATLMIGLLTIVIIIAVERTRFKRYSLVIALVVITILVPLMGLDSVALVSDITEIPRSLPIPKLPDLSLIPTMIVPALSITIIALVQAAGVSQSVPNPDGQYPDTSGDFLGQGIANIVAGSTGAIPVGGSLSGTTLIKSIGGVSRWANIFTGLFTAIIVMLFAPFIEVLPLPALAGMLIMVGISMIQTHRIRTVWNTDPTPVTIMLITFVGTLFTPLHVAVFIGVVLNIVLYIFQSAEAVRIERIIPQSDGGYIEGLVPKELNSNQIIILQPIGNLFFAGAAEFEEHLPEVGEARRAVVILRLRDRDEVGSTFIRILERFVRELHKQDNLLILVGLNKNVLEQLEKTDLLAEIGKENVFPATARFGESIGSGISAAEAWVSEKKN